MFNFSKLQFAKLSLKSAGEVEASIHSDLHHLRVPIMWPTAQGAPLPLFDVAQKAIVPGRSYGYINGSHPEARVWIVRQEEHYDIFVAQELSDDFTNALTLLSQDDIHVVHKGDGWTTLQLRASGSLPLAVAALFNWAQSLPWEGDTPFRTVERRF